MNLNEYAENRDDRDNMPDDAGARMGEREAMERPDAQGDNGGQDALDRHYRMTPEERAFCDRVNRPKRDLPSYDGVIGVAGAAPFRYHVSSCYDCDFTHAQVRDMVFDAARVAALGIDYLRNGKRHPKLIELTDLDCLRRLGRMKWLMRDALPDRLDLHSKGYVAPVMPVLVNGVILSPERFETAITMGVGTRHYRGNLLFERQGRRWICTVADVG